jgi:hypothetical protein
VRVGKEEEEQVIDIVVDFGSYDKHCLYEGDQYDNIIDSLSQAASAKLGVNAYVDDMPETKAEHGEEGPAPDLVL